MTALRKAGFYYKNYPHFDKVRGALPPALRSHAAAYLRSGTVLGISGGYYRDWFDPSKLAGEKAYLTDGLWVWPGHYTYYVEEYGFEVPQEFLARMEAHGWSAKQLTEDERQTVWDGLEELGVASGSQPPPEILRRSRR